MKVFQRTQCIATRFARSRASTLAVICGLVLLVTSGAAAATLFTVTNLVTDDQTAHSAQITDPRLQNAWGISASPGSPFWVSSNGKGVAELYAVNPTTNATTLQALSVTIPVPGGGTSAPTGQVFNGTSAFGSDAFIFATEDGTIAGWRGALGTTAETLFDNSGAGSVFKGITLGLTNNNNAYLYAADFHNNGIDVFPQTGAPSLTGNFTDPTLPSGFAPFNVANLGGTIYVAYAKTVPNSNDEADGAGFGFVSAFDLNGVFQGRVASQGTLNAPWGLAIAPASFGEFAGDLLVGNFGDGLISAFTPAGVPLGLLRDTSNSPIAIDGLWGLLPGNNGNGGSRNDIYFAAGPDGESHGLFGVIAPVGAAAAPEPSTGYILVLGLLALAWMRRSRSSALRAN